MDFGYDYRYEYSYDYPIGMGGGSGALAVFLTVYLIVLAVLLVVVLANYIFQSIGLYTIGKRMGRERPWLAFIPFARDYYHGELAGEIPLKNKSISNPGIWNLIVPIIYSAVMGVLVVFLMGAAMGVGAASGIRGGHAGGMSGMTAFVTTAFGVYIVLIVVAIVYTALYSVLRLLINIQIYERFTTRNMAAVHAVLSGFIPFYEAICLFVMRNKPFNPGMEPRLAPPPVPPVYPTNGSMPGNPPTNGPVPGNPPTDGPVSGQQDNKKE